MVGRIIYHKLFLALSAVVILLLSFFGRRLQAVMTDSVDSRVIGWGVLTVLMLLLCTITLHRRRNKLSWLIPLAAAVLLTGGGLAVYFDYLRPVEAVHFLVFSSFGWLSYAVFGLGHGLVVVASMAIGDEILQYFLPDRVGDLHDIIINTLSGLIGLLLRWQR